MEVADAGIVLGQVSRGGGAVLPDDIEEAGAVGIAQKREFVVGSLRFEAPLRLGHQLGGLFGTGSDDRRAVAEDQSGQDEERKDCVGHRAAVFLQEELGSVHCFAESLLPGRLLICHIE